MQRAVRRIFDMLAEDDAQLRADAATTDADARQQHDARLLQRGYVTDDDGSPDWALSVQYLELYQNKLRDLLSSEGDGKRLVLREAPPPLGTFVEGAVNVDVQDADTVLELFRLGAARRAVGAPHKSRRYWDQRLAFENLD